MTALTLNSVLDEIRRLYDNEDSGMLVLSNGSGQSVDVFFREGLIEGASSSLSGRRLGDYLAKGGYATVRDLDAVQPLTLRKGILFGEAVVHKGLASPAEVGAAVRRQAVELVDHAFKQGFAVDSFKSKLRSYYASPSISLPNILLELCRSNAAHFEPETNMRVGLRDGINLSLFHWYPQELHVLSELQIPSTFERLLNATGLQETNLKRVLAVFDGLGIIEALASLGSTEEMAQPGALVISSEFSFEHLIPVVTNSVLDEKLRIAQSESSFAGEQFKNLKVQISEVKSETPLKVLTVSSPSTQDGKSFISANLAFSFAMDPGRRVMIVDCDLRHPSLCEYLGVPSEPGLLQYLANGTVSPYCYVRRLQNLYFLTSGGVAANPVEILSMHKMRQLLEHLKKDFDTIILDAPPYFPIADARIITGLSDGLIMVVRRGKTSSRSCDLAFKAIDRNKLLGVVFNDVQPTVFHSSHNYGYYQYGQSRLDAKNNPRLQNTPKNYLES